MNMTKGDREPAATFDEFPKSFQLIERATRKRIRADCIPMTREVAKERIDKKWWMGLPCSKEVRRKQPDRDWNWVPEAAVDGIGLVVHRRVAAQPLEVMANAVVLEQPGACSRRSEPAAWRKLGRGQVESLR